MFNQRESEPMLLGNDETPSSSEIAPNGSGDYETLQNTKSQPEMKGLNMEPEQEMKPKPKAMEEAMEKAMQKVIEEVMEEPMEEVMEEPMEETMEKVMEEPMEEAMEESMEESTSNEYKHKNQISDGEEDMIPKKTQEKTKEKTREKPQEKTQKPEAKPTPPEEEYERSCWICFANEEENTMAAWVKPCKCKGTTKWVHEACLYRWIDEKQRGNALRPVHCQQCQTQYLIVFPQMGRFANMLEATDNFVKRMCPFLAAGVFVGSVYWTAVTYGAVTLLQIVGHEKGLPLIQAADPLVLLVGLPIIPVGLIIGRMVRWEDALIPVLRNARNALRKLPLMHLLIAPEDDSDVVEPEPEEPPEEDINDLDDGADMAIMPNLTDPTSATRIFCGAILLPTISSVVGRLLFDSVQNSVHRTLLGGLTFITLKGVFKIYLRDQQTCRKLSRRILDYTDENLLLYARSTKPQPPLINPLLLDPPQLRALDRRQMGQIDVSDSEGEDE